MQLISNGILVSGQLQFAFVNDQSSYTLPSGGGTATRNGIDATYTITVPSAQTVYISLYSETGVQDAFVFTNYNNPGTSVIASTVFNDVMVVNMSPNVSYYVNIDCNSGQGGQYKLYYSGFCNPHSVCGAGTFISRLTVNTNSTDTTVTDNPCENFGTDSYIFHLYNTANPYGNLTARYGSATPIRISHGNPGTGASMYDQVFIDLNHDGDYSDAGELVLNATSPQRVRKTSITIPSSYYLASQGTGVKHTTIRIRSLSVPFTNSLPCGSNSQAGQTADYTIDLSPPVTNVTPKACLNCNLCPDATYGFGYSVSAVDLPSSTVVTLQIASSASGTWSDIGSGTLASSFITGTIPHFYGGNGSGGLTAFFRVVTEAAHPTIANVASTQVDPSPYALTATDNSRCGTGTLFLAGTGTPNDATYLPTFQLFAAATGGSPIGTSGTSGATTPSTSSTTTYYLGYKYTYSQNGFGLSCSAITRLPVTATINPPPSISSFTPTSGPPGTAVLIKGSNFTGANNPFFNGQFANSAAIIDANDLSALVPSAATTGPISLSKTGCPTAVSASSFTVTTPTSSDLLWRWARFGDASNQELQTTFNRVRTLPSGDNLAAGSFFGTVSYDGSSPSVNITSAGGLDGLLVKYNKNGLRQWFVKFGGAGSDEVLGLATDKFGYAYVSGYFTGTMTITPNQGSTSTLTSAGGTDMFVAKVNPTTGALIYAFRMGGTGNDRAEGVDVAPDLRLYVAGSFIGNTNIVGLFGTSIPFTSRGNSDAFLAKFTDQGSLYWAIQAGGTGNDFGFGAAADITGGGYLMGSYETTATFNSSLGGTAPISKTAMGGSDGFVLGVSVTGQLNWVASMGGQTNENVRDVAADPRGTGLVAVGGFSGAATFGSLGTLTSTGFYDAFAVRLTNSGAFEWVQKSGGYGQDQAWGVRLDRKGNPLVAMSFSGIATKFGSSGPAADQNGSFGGLDGIVTKLAAATGVPIYTAQIAGIVGNDVPKGVDTVAQGGFVAAGFKNSFCNFGDLGPFGSVGSFIARYGTVASSSREGMDEASANAMAAGSTLALWPNPTSGRFSIRLLANPEVAQTGNASLRLYGSDGRLALTKSVDLSSLVQGKAIETSLPAGVYALHLREANGKTHQGRVVIK